MNKLIKKLADQHFVPDHRDENGRWEEYPHYEFEPEELKEFVQAIVLECADFLSLGGGDGHEEGKRLKRHFGVEE